MTQRSATRAHPCAQPGCVSESPHVHCPVCGLGNPARIICAYHGASDGDGWAQSNRAMCDYFHRKKLLARLSCEERADDFFAHAES